MAEEEAKPLDYINETILKKRKRNEEWALRKKEQLEQRKFKSKKNQDHIKKPEEFILEHRNRELDFIRLKQRIRRKGPRLVKPNQKTLLVIRVQGKNDMHPKTMKVLNNLRLRTIFSAVFVKENDGVMDKLRKVEPYVTYGYPNLKNIRELIYKRGYAKIKKQKVPLTDNNVIEQELGKYGILCIEDMVHEIANVGKHFKEVAAFLWPFSLSKPKEGLKGLKSLYTDGGDTGHREDHINELIDKMN